VGAPPAPLFRPSVRQKGESLGGLCLSVAKPCHSVAKSCPTVWQNRATVWQNRATVGQNRAPLWRATRHTGARPRSQWGAALPQWGGSHAPEAAPVGCALRHLGLLCPLGLVCHTLLHYCLWYCIKKSDAVGRTAGRHTQGTHTGRQRTSQPHARLQHSSRVSQPGARGASDGAHTHSPALTGDHLWYCTN
jgi:hypothetical protein